MDATAITDVENVPERGTFLFTVTEPSGREEEVILARVDRDELTTDGGDDSITENDHDDESDHDGAAGEDNTAGGEAGESEESTDRTDGAVEVRAWKNFCMHEPDQRLDRGGEIGSATRNGQVICPRHGSMFDLRHGGCDNGPARDQTLVGVDVTVRDGTVYLTDDGLTFEHEGGTDDDDMPSSTTHMSF